MSGEQEKWCEEEADLSQIPASAIERLTGFFHHREQMRGQRGICRVVLDRMDVSYRVILEEGHEFIDQMEEESGDVPVIQVQVIERSEEA